MFKMYGYINGELMAKFKPDFKKLQREMLQRMERKRRNKNNWCGTLGILNPIPQDIADFNAVMSEGKGYKANNKRGKMYFK